MIVTVLWEDQRGGQTRGFGPHELLIACLADDLGCARERLAHVVADPKKGNGNVRAALQRNLGRLAKAGPVVAVLDRDKAHELWRPSPSPACRTVLRERLQADAPGLYEVVFLEHNVETLIGSACRALGRQAPPNKPDPDERDRLLTRAAWSSSAEVRPRIRADCASFDRLVLRVAQHTRPAP